MMSFNYNQKNILFIILLLALLLRLGYVIFVPQIEDKELKDAWAYHRLASGLLSGKGYSGNIKCPPFYPVFLACTYSVFGHGFFAIRVIQAVISSISCIFIYLIARRCLNTKVALFAGFFSAFYPAFISYAGLPLTETLGTFLLLVFIYCLLSSLSSKKILWLLGGSISGGLLILCRAEMLLLGVFIILGMCMFKQFNRNSFVKVLSIVLFSLAVCLPWTIRNYLAFNRFVPVTIGFGCSLWLGSYPEDWTEWHDDREPIKSLKGKTQVKFDTELDTKLRKLAFENITTHPFIYLKLCMKKFFRFWVTSHSNTFKGLEQSFVDALRNRNLRILLPKSLLLILNLSLILSGFYGIFLAIKRHLNLCLIPILVIAYKSILHTIFVGAPRYQLLVMPYMIILAVYAWDELFKHNWVKRCNYESRIF